MEKPDKAYYGQEVSIWSMDSPHLWATFWGLKVEVLGNWNGRFDSFPYMASPLVGCFEALKSQAYLQLTHTATGVLELSWKWM